MSEAAAIHQSRYPYAETIARLTKAIRDGGGTIFATIDQSAAAQSVALTLRPTTLLVFGNPKSGTPLMDAFPLTALDLPLKFLVFEENGVVQLAYVTARTIAARYDVTGMDALIATLDGMLVKLAGLVS